MSKPTHFSYLDTPKGLPRQQSKAEIHQATKDYITPVSIQFILTLQPRLGFLLPMKTTSRMLIHGSQHVPGTSGFHIFSSGEQPIQLNKPPRPNSTLMPTMANQRNTLTQPSAIDKSVNAKEILLHDWLMISNVAMIRWVNAMVLRVAK